MGLGGGGSSTSPFVPCLMVPTRKPVVSDVCPPPQQLLGCVILDTGPKSRICYVNIMDIGHTSMTLRSFCV